MEKLNIDIIRLDGGTQCRKVIDQALIYRYLENMKEGDEFPALDARFDGVNYWLTDGFHRYHAYKLLNIKEIQVNVKFGTKLDAILDALQANDKHGLPLSNEDKRHKVEMALKIEGFEEKSDYEIAKICRVSRSFVAAVRNPEAKERQQNNRDRSNKKKVEASNKEEEKVEPITEKRSRTTSPDPVPVNGDEPDEAELLANQKKHESDLEALAKFLDADDKAKHLYEENQKLSHLVVMKDMRIKELMNEKQAAVKMVKDLQRQLDKLKAKK